MSQSMISKLFGGASVLFNEIVEKGIGSERLEKAQLNEIKDLLDKAEVEEQNAQATYNILKSDLKNIDTRISELNVICDDNGNKFKETQDESYKTKAKKAISLIQKTQRERDEKVEDLNKQEEVLQSLSDSLVKLRQVYEKRKEQHDSAVTLNNSSQSTSKAADLISELTEQTNSAGNSKFAEQSRHNDEVARLKIAKATEGHDDSVEDFIKQSKADSSKTSEDEEFEKRFGK